LRLWAQTGLRQGEVAALQTQDLDLDRGLVVVRRTWSRGRLGPPKTRQSRVVACLHPISEDTPEWRPGRTTDARRLLAELKALPVRSVEPEAFVFGVTAPWGPGYVNAQWRQTLRVAKVRYRNPEQLRHTFASTLLSRNAPPLYVQQQGGWRSAAVLFRVYARWMPQGEPDATPAQPAPEAENATY
jgi:integrase